MDFNIHLYNLHFTHTYINTYTVLKIYIYIVYVIVLKRRIWRRGVGWIVLPFFPTPHYRLEYTHTSQVFLLNGA